MSHYNLAVVFAPNLIKITSGELGLTGVAIAIFHALLGARKQLLPDLVDESLVEFEKYFQDKIEETKS